MKTESLVGHAWTIAGWVKVGPGQGADRVIAARGMPRMSHFRLYVQPHFGLLRFYTFNLGDFGCGVVDDDRWHHVAVTQREYALTFYLDGMALYTFNVPGGIVACDDPVTRARDLRSGVDMKTVANATFRVHLDERFPRVLGFEQVSTGAALNEWMLSAAKPV